MESVLQLVEPPNTYTIYSTAEAGITSGEPRSPSHIKIGPTGRQSAEMVQRLPIFPLTNDDLPPPISNPVVL